MTPPDHQGFEPIEPIEPTRSPSPPAPAWGGGLVPPPPGAPLVPPPGAPFGVPPGAPFGVPPGAPSPLGATAVEVPMTGGDTLGRRLRRALAVVGGIVVVAIVVGTIMGLVSDDEPDGVDIIRESATTSTLAPPFVDPSGGGSAGTDGGATDAPPPERGLPNLPDDRLLLYSSGDRGFGWIGERKSTGRVDPDDGSLVLSGEDPGMQVAYGPVVDAVQVMVDVELDSRERSVGAGRSVSCQRSDDSAHAIQMFVGIDGIVRLAGNDFEPVAADIGHSGGTIELSCVRSGNVVTALGAVDGRTVVRAQVPVDDLEIPWLVIVGGRSTRPLRVREVEVRTPKVAEFERPPIVPSALAPADLTPYGTDDAIPEPEPESVSPTVTPAAGGGASVSDVSQEAMGLVLPGGVVPGDVSVAVSWGFEAADGPSIGAGCLDVTDLSRLRYRFAVAVDGRWYVLRDADGANGPSSALQASGTATGTTGGLTEIACSTITTPEGVTAKRVAGWIGANQIFDVVDLDAPMGSGGWRGMATVGYIAEPGRGLPSPALLLAGAVRAVP